MKRFFLIFCILFAQLLFADTWLGGGGGIFFPLKSGNYSFNPGIGWKVNIQHNLLPQNSNYIGFLIGISGYQNEINNFYFDDTSFRLRQNDIQLGLIYNFYKYNDHTFEVYGGYLSKGIEGDLNLLNISQTDSGFFIGFSDKYSLNEYFVLEGSLAWHFFETDTNWGKLEMSGPRVEILIWMNILSSE